MMAADGALFYINSATLWTQVLVPIPYINANGRYSACRYRRYLQWYKFCRFQYRHHRGTSPVLPPLWYVSSTTTAAVRLQTAATSPPSPDHCRCHRPQVNSPTMVQRLVYHVCDSKPGAKFSHSHKLLADFLLLL